MCFHTNHKYAHVRACIAYCTGHPEQQQCQCTHTHIHTRILWDRCHLALSRTCRCGERARRRSERKRASGPPRTNTHVKDFHCTAETEKQKGERQTWKTKSAYRTLFVTPHCWHLFRKYALASFSPRPPRENKKNRSPSVDFRRVKPSSSPCPLELYPQRERKSSAD